MSCRLIMLAFLAPLLTTCGGGPKSAAPSQVSEAWDVRNEPKLLGMDTLRYEELTQAKARRGGVEEGPWKDDYWPYYRKNMAYRYITKQEFKSFEEQITQAKQAATDPFLSPSEKYDLLRDDVAFSLTKDSWDLFQHYDNKYPMDPKKWKWMGICSGWAPASIAEKAPRHNVLAVSSKGREILFFQGDLRGLLSKAYDMNTMSESYKSLGTRCNVEPEAVPRDEGGRPVDGQFLSDHQTFNIIYDKSYDKGVLEVTDSKNMSGTTFWLVLDKLMARLEGQALAWIYHDKEALLKDLAAGTRGQHAQPNWQQPVHFYKGCRDVNPASFHLALVRHLSDIASKKTAFIADLSRHSQVWNHPIWGFVTEVGRPRLVALDKSPTRPFRAKGATHVADVTTKLVYVLEDLQPLAEYPSDFDFRINYEKLENNSPRYALHELKYSLEFDANGYLIGGEWLENEEMGPKIPDFFWRIHGTLTDTNKDGKPSILKYSLLRRLLDCSFSPQTEPLTVKLPDQPEPVSAVRCPVNAEDAGGPTLQPPPPSQPVESIEPPRAYLPIER